MRDEYTKKLKLQLEEWSTQIDLLEIKAKQADLSMRLAYQEKVQALKLKRDEARTRLSELHNATDEAWEVLKEGSESIWDTMKQTLHDVKAKFDKDER